MATNNETRLVRLQAQDIERLDNLQDVLGASSRISTVRALMDAAPAYLAVQKEIREMSKSVQLTIERQDEKMKQRDSIIVNGLFQIRDEVSTLKANIDRARESSDDVNRLLTVLLDGIDKIDS